MALKRTNQSKKKNWRSNNGQIYQISVFCSVRLGQNKITPNNKNLSEDKKGAKTLSWSPFFLLRLGKDFSSFGALYQECLRLKN